MTDFTDADLERMRAVLTRSTRSRRNRDAIEAGQRNEETLDTVQRLMADPAFVDARIAETDFMARNRRPGVSGEPAPTPAMDPRQLREDAERTAYLLRNHGPDALRGDSHER